MTVRKDKVRCGLIGCGVMGKSLATHLVAIEQAELVLVCDTQPEPAKALSEELGVPMTTDPQALFARDDVDAVLIATPGFTHADLTVMAAQAGKHVFCEKPMALTLEDCDRMIAACREKGVNLMVGHVCRYHPIHAKVRELVVGGEIGKLLCLVVHRLGGGYAGVWARDWRKSRQLSGGMLLEVNVHELDFLRWVGGEVASVFAVGDNFLHPDCDYPDCVLVTFRFRSGALGLLHASQVSALGGYGGRADGEKGSLLFPSFWGKDAHLIVRTAEGERIFHADDLATESPVRQELEEFVASIRERRPPAIMGEDGRAAVELALAAYRSMETGSAVHLPLTDGWTDDA
jgi:predicted dehydrogenase